VCDSPQLLRGVRGVASGDGPKDKAWLVLAVLVAEVMEVEVTRWLDCWMLLSSLCPPSPLLLTTLDTLDTLILVAALFAVESAHIYLVQTLEEEPTHQDKQVVELFQGKSFPTCGKCEIYAAF
jgi:hypothetical protein